MSEDSLAEAQGVPQYDPDASLCAIFGLLMNLRGWLEAQEQEIRLAESKHESELYVDLCSEYVYAEAASSQATVGAVAPFFEGMFSHEFSALHVLGSKLQLVADGHRRGKVPGGTHHEKFWLPHAYVDDNAEFSEERDVHRGAMQLLKALSLLDRFPKNFGTVTRALFTFRNRSLHSGHEWRLDSRARFVELVEKEHWAKWFSWSTRGDQPWIACMTPEFIDECVWLAVEALSSFRKIRWEWMAKQPLPDDVPAWIKDKTTPTELEGIAGFLDAHTHGLYEQWLKKWRPLAKS